MKKLISFLRGRAVYSALILVFYLAVVISMVSPVTLSSYNSSAEGEDTGVVAKFAFSFNYTNEEVQAQDIMIENFKPGDTKEIKLTVTNNSEVSIKYKFNAFVKHGNIPLKCEFSSDGEGELLNGENDSATHTMTVTWYAETNSAEYAGEVDTITVTLFCEQKD